MGITDGFTDAIIRGDMEPTPDHTITCPECGATDELIDGKTSGKINPLSERCFGECHSKFMKLIRGINSSTPNGRI